MLNRCHWSALTAARILFLMLVYRFAASGPMVMGLDDTIERRWGAKIKACGIYEAVDNFDIAGLASRLVRDYEARMDVSEAMIDIAMGGLMIRRIAHHSGQTDSLGLVLTQRKDDRWPYPGEVSWRPLHSSLHPG